MTTRCELNALGEQLAANALYGTTGYRAVRALVLALARTQAGCVCQLPSLDVVDRLPG